MDLTHSSWIDLLIQHVAGFIPDGSDTLIVDPVHMGWKLFSRKNIRYRNPDIDIEYSWRKEMVVRVDGMVEAKTDVCKK